MVRKRIQLAQNFFRDRRLVASIIADSSLGGKDVVYEIGPGGGIITERLAEQVDRVVAIEKDPVLAAWLREKFRDRKSVQVHEGDFLKYEIEDRKYKIFSNIPFNITAEVVKRILFGENPPSEAYLVVQREAARKFAGIPHETEMSVLAKTRFAFRILREFNAADFDPMPSVSVVLLRITKREQPLVPAGDLWKYRKFVQFGFRAWKKDLKTAYKKVFTYEQWKRLSKDLSFNLGVVPTELSFEQWLGLFKYFLTGVADSKKAWVLR